MPIEATVSVRLPADVLEMVDEIAEAEGRSRSNLIARALKSFADRERQYGVLASTIDMIYSNEATTPERPELAEYARGAFYGAKRMLSTLCGDHVVQQLLQLYRERNRRRVPHIVPLAADGNRHGFDSDAG